MSRRGFSPSMAIKNDANAMYCFPAVRQALPNRGSKSERWCWGGNLETEPVLSVACGCSCTPSKKKNPKNKNNLCPSLPLGICSQITGLNFSCREKKAKRAEMEDRGPPESR